MTTALAVDLGSSSGRVIAGTLVEGRIEQHVVHRFAHQAVRRGGALVWDLERLWEETVRGLREAMALFPDAVSVSVDTWGVDFVPLDEDDRVVGEPRAYRDERTARTLEDFRALVDDRESSPSRASNPRRSTRPTNWSPCVWRNRNSPGASTGSSCCPTTSRGACVA